MATKASIFLETKRITTKEMYKKYVKKYPDSEIAKTKNYNLFKLLVCETNKEIVKELLKGGIYNFGSNVGTLEVTKFTRVPRIDKDGKMRGMNVDFGATRKNKALGNTEVIYHTHSLVCRWTYRRGGGSGFRLVNKSMWQFAFTDGPKGISRQLHHYIEANPNCAVNYRTNQYEFKTEDNE